MAEEIIFQRTEIKNQLIEHGTSRSAKLLHGKNQLLITDAYDYATSTNKDSQQSSKSYASKIQENCCMQIHLFNLIIN